MVRWLRDPVTQERLDQGMVITFPAPASFTGEDIVEFQVHGSPAVCRSLLAVLARMPGLRAAEPGEFTRRALMNDRLDLSQVEGLGDLLAAETVAQQRMALELMGGALSRRAADWGGRLVKALAFVEAAIDFADEDLPDDLVATVRGGLLEIAAGMRREADGSQMAERVRDGFEVALVGRPNVGKSTLLNALAGREAALTSEVAGTTRDVIEVRMDAGGLALTLLDMAGLRVADGVEALGVARARSRAERADLRVFLVEKADDVDRLGLEVKPEDIVVLAKADLSSEAGGLAVSGLTGQGIDELIAVVRNVLGERAAGAGVVSHARQREAIERATLAVQTAQELLGREEPPIELVAAELRAALQALDFLIGRMDVEAVLDAIFQSFCIGK